MIVSLQRHLSPSHLGMALLAAATLSSLVPANAAQVGSNQGVNFGQAVLASSCSLSTTDGSLGVRTNRTLITSDSGEGGQFNGTPAAATISASSNLTETGFVKVESFSLTGGTPGTSSVKFGASGTWGPSAQVNLGTGGELAGTPLHVRFTPQGSRFANGTYTASATVSCYDGI